MRSLLLVPLIALPVAGLVPAAGSVRYENNPPPAHTGGFGEPTCRVCHFDNPQEAPGGRVVIGGVPASYTPGREYVLTVTLTRGDIQRAGFQLAARHSGDRGVGEQAGTLSPTGERVAVVASPEGIRYAYHSVVGTRLSGPDSASWSVRWRAPDSGDPVAIHVAANAANGDGSEFGDFIYTATATSRGAEK